MKNIIRKSSVTALLVLSSLLFIGCPEEGESGSEPLDCGDLGAEHDGHCHCNEGALFDGETCVTAGDIVEICIEEVQVEDTDTVTDADTAAHAEEHADEAACRCPVDGDCPCDHGEIVESGGVTFCTPELHAEE